MSDNTPTPDGTETTVQDPDEPGDADEQRKMAESEFKEAHEQNIERAAREADRETRRVELELPDELAVYDTIRHRGGDQTILILSEFGEGYQALAFDINAAGEILETEIVNHADTEERAVSMCEYWMQANDKGVLGATQNPNGSAAGGSVVDQLKETFRGLGE